MRKTRIVTWVITLVICAILIRICENEEKKIPYEERTPINVYCIEEFQERVKKIIEKSSIGDTHRVVFTDNKEISEFILTDRILVSDNGYEKVGWTPLIVAFDDTTENKMDYYEEGGYITSESEGTYVINFEKIIEDTLKGEWKDKIYCPNVNTREGEIFFDFLLININGGIYPKNEQEMEGCVQLANEFLSNSIVVQTNTTEKLMYKKVIQEELFIIFEKEIYNMSSDTYKFQISYPTNTVTYEYYYCCQGENATELEKVMNESKGFEYGNRIQDIMYDNHIRNDSVTYAYNSNYYAERDGFSYVEVPLKEE